MAIVIGVLGAVAAWQPEGDALALKGPRHRAVLARLVVARRRVVPVDRLVEDLWGDEPPGDGRGAVRTFVAALRRSLEPDRPPRSAPRLLVTEGPGYALRAETDAVDAWRFERAATAPADVSPERTVVLLTDALALWRGPAFAEFGDAAWAWAEARRLTEMRLHALERLAEARLALGLAAQVAAEFESYVSEHPWRENAWRLLALALYRTGRQGDALGVLRRARTLLARELGVDPGQALRRLESDILRQADRLAPAGPPAHPAERVWTRAAAAYDRDVPAHARARLEASVTLLRGLAVSGGAGLSAAREQRLAGIAEAERTGGADLAARVIGGYDVPAVWTRSDDPEQASQVVAAAERALAALPRTEGAAAARARLLATVALETRGAHGDAGAPAAARQAERLARGLGDPRLLAFALNARFMQTFARTGLAPARDATGAELVTLSARHGLVTHEVLGHLVRSQARGALGDFAGADRHAAAADRLAERHELPLVAVFTRWYRVMRLAAADNAPVADVTAAYREAAGALAGSGMPGLRQGLLPLALLCLHVSRGLPAPTPTADFGPYTPWARPLVLLALERREEAAEALRTAPGPPRDLLSEALWCLVARAALELRDRAAMARAHTALAPAARELAGAASGLLTLGPVHGYLDALTESLGRPA